MRLDRRNFLMGSVATCAMTAAGDCIGDEVEVALDAGIGDLQRRAFDGLVHLTDAERGMTPLSWPDEPVCSVAACGLALTAWPVGVENGWMGREEARMRSLSALRFFHDVEVVGAGHRGVFYRHLDMQTGHRSGQAELSIDDTALLVGGMLFAARFFDGDQPDEVEIRRLAQAVYDRVDWRYGLQLSRASTGGSRADRTAGEAGMLALLLAIGSETYPIPASTWDRCCSTRDRQGRRADHPASYPFVNWRGLRDASIRAQSVSGTGLDYFQQQVRAVASQRAYAVENSGRWDGYSADIWGFGTVRGPGDFRQVIDAERRRFLGRAARGPGQQDDGTLAPAALLASYVFAPGPVTAAVKALQARYGAAVDTRWGLASAFNPSLTEREGTLPHGRIIPGVGWVDDRFVGVDQGSVVVMIQNARSGLVWRLMCEEPNLRRGLRRAGFTGGWLDA